MKFIIIIVLLLITPFYNFYIFKKSKANKNEMRDIL